MIRAVERIFQSKIGNDDLVIASTGLPARVVYHVHDSQNNFYVQGSMGASLGIGIGLALNRPERKVHVIAGDADILMSLGTVVLMNKLNLPNLHLHILDNNACVSTGGQATCSDAVDFESMAKNVSVYKIPKDKPDVGRIPLKDSEIAQRFHDAINSPPTLVCSESTRKFFPDIKDVFIVKHAPTKEFVEKFAGSRKSSRIIAVGGGAVMDTAKILGGEVEAYPTTAAGSVTSDHAVYWDGPKKCSFQCKAPKVFKIVPEYLMDLPDEVIEYTLYDTVAHALESLWSKNKTEESEKYATAALAKISEITKKSQTLKIDEKTPENLVKLIEAGNLAGKALGITHSNVMHALSYPLTEKYKVPHGKALGWLLPRIAPYYSLRTPEVKGLDKLNVNIERARIDINYVIEEALKYPKIHDTTKEINKGMLLKILL